MALHCRYGGEGRRPGLARPYRVPVYPWLPIFVVLLSVLAGYYYAFYNRKSAC
jgi:hypothetical protein